MLYVHTQTKNSSNVPFDTDFIKFKIVDKKVPKRTAIQETVLDAVRGYNEVRDCQEKRRPDGVRLAEVHYPGRQSAGGAL